MGGYPRFYGYQSSIIHAFMDIHLDIIGFLWISMHGFSIQGSCNVFERMNFPPFLFCFHSLTADRGTRQPYLN